MRTELVGLVLLALVALGLDPRPAPAQADGAAAQDGDAPPSIRETLREQVRQARALRHGRDFGAAEGLLWRTHDAAEEGGFVDVQARALVELGATLGTAGALDRAVEPVERGVALARRLDDAKLLGLALRRLGELANAQGRHAAAEAALDEAAELYRQQGDRLRLARLAATRSRFANHRGDYLGALDHGHQALPELEGGSLLDVISNMAYAHQQLGNLEQAADTYDRVLELAWKIGSLGTLDFAYCNRAEVRWKMGDDRPALDDLERAVDGFEAGRAGILGGPEERADYLDRQVLAYDRLIRYRSDTADPAAAFRAAERFHGRSFLDLLDEDGLELLTRRSTRSAANPQPANPDLEPWLSPEPPDLDALRRALADDETLIAYWVSDERLFAWTLGPVSRGAAGELHQVQMPLDRRQLEARLETYLRPLYSSVAAEDLALAGGERDHLEAGEELHRWLVETLPEVARRADRWILVPDGPLHRLPFGALVEGCDGEADAGGSRGTGAAAREALHGAYARCRYLGLRKALVSAPSAGAWLALRQRRRARPAATGPLLAVSPSRKPSHDPGLDSPRRDAAGGAGTGAAVDGPELLHGRDEVERVARHVGARAGVDPGAVITLVGEQATEANLRRRIADRRIVHLAAHGLVDDDRPLDSAVQLWPSGTGGPDHPEEGALDDGYLRMAEVLDLRLRADLVTISACRSGRGRWRRGEGFFGLGQAFLAVGASALVSSLWDVDDHATLLLMDAFYGDGAAGGSGDGRRAEAGGWPEERPAERLRRARQALLELETSRRLAFREQAVSLAHPRFWAAFRVLGDG